MSIAGGIYPVTGYSTTVKNSASHSPQTEGGREDDRSLTKLASDSRVQRPIVLKFFLEKEVKFGHGENFM